MTPVVSSIALGIVSNLATDILKAIGGSEPSALGIAIRNTALSFPELEGLEDTLRRWVLSCYDALGTFIEGEVGRNEVPVQELASVLVNKAEFYLAEHSQATAEKIVTAFLAKVRVAYLTNTSAGLLHVANRQEARFDSLQEQLHRLTLSVESAGGLRPALQKHYDQAVARLDASDYLGAKALFESLLAEIETVPERDQKLQRNIHVRLGKISAALGEDDEAIRQYRRAAEVDNDPVRAAVNSAVADLIEGNPDESLQHLENVRGPDTPTMYEYSAAKVGALLRLKRYKEALIVASEVSVQAPESRRFELLGTVHREMNDLSSAEKAFRSALDLNASRPELQYALAEVLFTPVIEFRNNNPGLALPSELSAHLDESATLLARASGTFRDEGRTRAALQVESTLGLLRFLQDRFGEAIRILEPVSASQYATSNDWRNLGLAYLLSNDPARAAAAFTNSLSLGRDEQTDLLFAQALLMGGKADAALAYSETRATGSVTVDNAKWHILKASALSAKRQFAKARDVLTTLLKEFPTNAEVLLTLAELYEATGNTTEAKTTYDEALLHATGPDALRARYMFGGFSAKQKDFKRAVDLWRPLVRMDRPNTLLDNYLAALYNLGQLREIETITNTFKKSNAKLSVMFAEVAAATCQKLDDLAEAGAWLEYLCERYGNKPEYIMRLSSLKIRLGKRNEALELLDASKASLQEPHEMMGYAQAYLILGRHREAILLAHNAVRCSSDPEIHMGYVMVFSSADDAVERTAEEIATFQDVLTRFKERFPTSTHFQSFKIDPENPLDAIRETLERHSAHALNVIKAYQDRRMPLPLSVFAKLLGRDLYEVWLHVVSNPNLTLLTASGTEEETQDSLRILNNATGFIADAITLFTFSRLDLLANLESLGDIYIAQATLDQLHELELKRVASDKTMGTIGMIEGKFFLREFTSEELQEMNAGLHTAIAWAEQHARAIGLKEPYTAEDEKWIAVLGDASVETMLIAKQRGLVLLTDDKNYGDLARQNYGTVFVNGAAALLYMHNKGLLSHTRFDKAVLKLAEDGYSFIRIDDNQLFELVASEQFQVTDRVKRVCRVLEQPTVALAGACGAIAGMLRRLYLEPIPDQMRQQLAFYMLDALAKTHAKMDIQRLIRALLRQQMQPLLILQLRQLEEMLDRW